ncbi:glycosyltransferase family 4 protein [Serratia bockelmannii]|uniref:glycosyltransferase family 4 protein n=1 Tax=Serratia bockelmannii TaxID=2703793 RepID=UPI003FA7A17C
MRVLIINTLYAPNFVGGAERSVQLLSEELVKNGDDVRVISLHKRSTRECAVINGVEVVYLPLRNVYWPFDNLPRRYVERLVWHFIDNYNPRMKELISSEILLFSPDIVHTNNLCGFSVAVWDAAHKCGVKIIHTARDYYLFHPNSTLYKKGRNTNERSVSVLIFSFIKKLKSRKVSLFVGISDYIKNFHTVNGFFSSRDGITIYNAVSINQAQRERDDTVKIGYIGRLSEEKGFDDFCSAIIFLRNKNISIEALAAGRANNSKNSNAFEVLADAANVRISEYKDIQEFLSKIDVVILPTKWREPFGRTIVESALANKPVFTNPIGGIVELMSLLPNVKPLVLKDVEREILIPNVAFPDTRDVIVFSIEKTTNEYKKIYERVCSRT